MIHEAAPSEMTCFLNPVSELPSSGTKTSPQNSVLHESSLNKTLHCIP